MITCRILHDHELTYFEQFLKARNSDSRAMYFGAAVANEYIHNLVDHIEDSSSQHWIVVAENTNANIIGTIHLARINDHAVELAIMVDEQHRGQGISTQLMDYAMAWSRNRGYRDVYMHCLGYNQPVMHLVKKYGLEVVRDAGDADAHVTLPYANVFTWQYEALLRQSQHLAKTLQTFKRIIAA